MIISISQIVQYRRLRIILNLILNNRKFIKKICLFTILIAGITITCILCYRRYLKKNNFVVPERIMKFEKDMVKTNQEIQIKDYKIKLVGVLYENDQKKIDSMNLSICEGMHGVYICKFEVRNPNVNFRKCIKRDYGDYWIGEYGYLRIFYAYEALFGVNGVEEYFQLNDGGVDVYVCMSFEKDYMVYDKEYYSTWCECLYVQQMEYADDYGIKDMSGVFNLNIAGKEKVYRYPKAADTKITVTERNMYFNGKDIIDAESIVLHMKDGSCKDIDKEMQVPVDPGTEGIVDYGEYRPSDRTDDGIKTYTRLIHFSDGTDVENIEYIEINGERLEEQKK